jgi:hypothetical protein
VLHTPPRVHLVGFRWGFTRKRNENNEVMRYKARLVAQGFTPVMNVISFRYLVSLVLQKCLSLQLMDAVITYLYRSLDSDISMKVSNGISHYKKPVNP